MTDVTTHSNVIRPDRMALLTESDRIIERLRRLENAAAAGPTIEPGTQHQIYIVKGTGTVGPLGSTWQFIPGMTKTLTLKTDDIVLLDASVSLLGATPEVFWVIDGVLAQHQNVYARTALGFSYVNAALFAYYVSPNDASHTFQVHAADSIGAGATPGHAQGANSHIRLTVLGGLRGPKGDVGPAGPSGSGGDKNYVHNQGSGATVWNVVHGLGKFPAVNVVDTGGNWLLPDVQYVDANTLTVTFATATSGKAYVN